MTGASKELNVRLPRLPKFIQQYDEDGDGELSDSEFEKIHQLNDIERSRIEEEAAFMVVLEILAAAKHAKSKLVPNDDISFDEFSVLAVLQTDLEKNKKNASSYMGLLQSFISTATNLPASTISTLLDKLINRKGKDESETPWITRVENPANRREKLIGITSSGKSQLRKARNQFKNQIRASLLSALNLPQLLHMWDTLSQFNITLNPDHDPDPIPNPEPDLNDTQT